MDGLHLFLDLCTKAVEIRKEGKGGHKKYPRQPSVLYIASLVQGTNDSHGTALENMGVDHGGLHIFMSEQFLNCTNIITALEKVCGIGWKGGALSSYEDTFPPSPLQTGRAIFKASGFPT